MRWIELRGRHLQTQNSLPRPLFLTRCLTTFRSPLDFVLSRLLVTLAIGSLVLKKQIRSQKKLDVHGDATKGKIDVTVRREAAGLSVVLNKLNLKLAL
jgi:hypothetical protein